MILSVIVFFGAAFEVFNLNTIFRLLCRLFRTFVGLKQLIIDFIICTIILLEWGYWSVLDSWGTQSDFKHGLHKLR